MLLKLKILIDLIIKILKYFVRQTFDNWFIECHSVIEQISHKFRRQLNYNS